MSDGKRSAKAAMQQAKLEAKLEYKKAKLAAKKPFTTMKWIVLFSLLNGYAWVWCSYILAFQEKYQIAETLSQVAITEIIGVVLVYALKALVENLSKNNQWPDKPWKNQAQEPEIVVEPTGLTEATKSGLEVEMAEDASVSALDYLNTDSTTSS